MITAVFVVFFLANSPRASAADLGKSVCQNMWNKAQDQTLHFGVDFNVNPQGQRQRLYQTTQTGDDKINNADEFADFRDLLQSYTWSFRNQQRRIRPGQRTDARRDAFLNQITQQDGPIEQAFQYLREKGLLPDGNTLNRDFKDRLLQMWFQQQPQDQMKRTGFQNTFVGEKSRYRRWFYRGFYNWYQFNLEQEANRIHYVRLSDMRFNGDSEPPFMANLIFQWYGIRQKHFNNGRNMFVGTSPSFEIALYSVCFIEHPGQPCSCNIGRSTVTVQTYDATRIGGTVNQISKAFPVDVVIQASRCVVHGSCNQVNCGWQRITQNECLNRGCCYDSTQERLCFFPRDHKCDVIDPNDRTICGDNDSNDSEASGDVGITRHVCEVTYNCCYDDSVPNVPVCYEGRN